MKIILDNNIYISSIVFDSQMEDFVNHIYGILNYNFYFSTETFIELENTLNSSKFAKLLAKSTRQLTLETRLEYFEQIKSNSIFKGEIKTKVDICRDPKDNKFLALAKEIQANYLITGDKDLLVLKEFETTKILSPGEFLELI
jgi:uncharacterized protein